MVAHLLRRLCPALATPPPHPLFPPLAPPPPRGDKAARAAAAAASVIGNKPWSSSPSNNNDNYDSPMVNKPENLPLSEARTMTTTIDAKSGMVTESTETTFFNSNAPSSFQSSAMELHLPPALSVATWAQSLSSSSLPAAVAPAPSLPSYGPRAPREIIVGVVSARLRNHPAARLLAGLLLKLGERKDQYRIQRLAMCFPTVVDPWTRALNQNPIAIAALNEKRRREHAKLHNKTVKSASMSGDGGKNDPAGELLEIPGGWKRLKPDGSVKFIRKPAGRRDFGPTGGYGLAASTGPSTSSRPSTCRRPASAPRDRTCSSSSTYRSVSAALRAFNVFPTPL